MCVGLHCVEKGSRLLLRRRLGANGRGFLAHLKRRVRRHISAASKAAWAAWNGSIAPIVSMMSLVNRIDPVERVQHVVEVRVVAQGECTALAGLG